MNRRQKLVQQEFLNQEDIVIKRLGHVYDQALKDLNGNIENLQLTIDGLKLQYDWMDVDDPAKEQVKSMIQSKIYQKKYQEALHAQVSDILDNMGRKQYATIADYLDGCYNDGFIGTVFDLHGQGIPMIIPINQESMVRAVQLDSKISHGLYTRLGEDIDMLKRKILGQVSRSISTGTSYADAAKQLANYTNVGFNNAIRITRTEGHRIQTTAAMDALENAKEKGADVVKQWDSTLDKRTRESHQHVDGEIRELDEPFSNGLMYPGDPDGAAAEVINCRCALLQRAKWALDDDELQTMKKRAGYFGLDKTKDFDDFKSKYLKAVEETLESTTTPTITNVADCKTVEEVEDLMKGKGWFRVETRNGKVYDTNQMLSLTGVDLECAKSFYTTHEKLFTKYPQLVGKLNSIGCADLGGMTYAQCSFGLGHGGLTVNNRFFRDLDYLKRTYSRDLEHGFHPAGTTWESIVTHELGHAIDDYLTNTLYLAGMKNSIQPKIVSADMRPKVMRACKLKVSTVAKEVSGYATKDHLEWFAECFSEYMDSETPRKVASEFGKQFEELMKKVK